MLTLWRPMKRPLVKHRYSLCKISRIIHVSQPYGASDSQVQTLGRDLAAALLSPHMNAVFERNSACVSMFVIIVILIMLWAMRSWFRLLWTGECSRRVKFIKPVAEVVHLAKGLARAWDLSIWRKSLDSLIRCGNFGEISFWRSQGPRKTSTCLSCSERADAGILLLAYPLTLFSLSKGAAEGMTFSPLFLATFTSYYCCMHHCMPLWRSWCF